MFKVTALVILVLLAVHGCSHSTVKQDGAADVTSSPSGATVYANGKKLGITPLHYELYKVFPAGWNNMMYQAQGVLMVKMDGCEDYILDVNDYILSKPVHVELQCGGVSDAELSLPAEQAVDNQKPAPVVMPQTETGKRLEELDTLYQKGLITTEEYNATRERILNEL